NVGLGRARGALRAGLVHSLLTGDPTLARRVSRELWGALPTAPVAVAVAELTAARVDAAVDWLELHVNENRGSLFHGRGPDGMVLVAPADLAPALLKQF